MGSLYSKCRQALAPSKIVISLKTSVSGRFKFEFELKIMVPEEGLVWGLCTQSAVRLLPIQDCDIFKNKCKWEV